MPSKQKMPFSLAPRAAAIETLEGRTLMSVVVGLQPKNVLISVDSSNPAEVLATTKVKGLAKRESLVGIDFRPATGELFGVGSSSQLYRIDLTSGGATKVGGTFSAPLVGTKFGVDFEPTTDLIRIVSDSDQNMRVQPTDGAVIDTDPDAGTQTDTDLDYVAGDPGASIDATIVDAAYATNTGGAPSTRLYAIDANLKTLVAIGSVGGGPASTNAGQLFTVGSLGISPISFDGFDISTVNGTDTAYAAFRSDAKQPSQLYTVNLGTGAVAAGGNIGKKRTETLDIAVAPVGVNFVAVTAKNQLLTLNSAVPQLVVGSLKISGLAKKDKIAAIDFRPSNQVLYAITTGDQLYTINTANGIATPIGTTTAVDLDGKAEFDLDFEPGTDTARVVNNSDQNLRIDPSTGAVVDFNPNVDGVQGDTNLAYIAGDSKQGANPSIVGLAYSNNVAGGTPTTAYGIDSGTNSLVTLGSPAGSPTPPTTGQLSTVGPLGVNVSEVTGFDIRSSGGGDVAYATFLADNKRDGLYTVNLQNGAASFLGGLNKQAKGVRDIAIVPG